jgi:hypothetical protein
MPTNRTTGKRLFQVIEAGIWDRVEKMSNAELKMLELTESNCGWVEYGIGPTIADIASGILKYRSARKRKERKAAKGVTR